MSLASYKKGRVSLPASVHGCPPLASTLSAEALIYLDEYKQRMVRDTEEVASIPVPNMHFDPKLGNNAASYRKFIFGVGADRHVDLHPAPAREVRRVFL